MQTSHIRLVQATWQQLAPEAAGTARHFYARLFELDPTLGRLFPGDVSGRANRFAEAVVRIVGALDEADALLPALELIGRRHADDGVLGVDYDTVARALLDTLAHALGDDFTPAVRDAWSEIYATITGVMRRAAAELLAQRRTAAIGAAIAATIGQYGFSQAGLMAAFA